MHDSVLFVKAFAHEQDYFNVVFFSWTENFQDNMAALVYVVMGVSGCGK